jgi:hypothetical protein
MADPSDIRYQNLEIYANTICDIKRKKYSDLKATKKWCKTIKPLSKCSKEINELQRCKHLQYL